MLDSTPAGEITYATSGLVRLTKPQLVGTLVGLMLAALLAAIDQTIVGTAEPRIIRSDGDHLRHVRPVAAHETATGRHARRPDARRAPRCHRPDDRRHRGTAHH